MPSLRVVTWNSSGEADGRGPQLVTAVGGINAFYGPQDVQLVVIQEANVTGGSIANALANSPPFNAQFIQPQGFCREHALGLQPHQITPSKAYRLSWMVNGPVPTSNLVAVGAGPQLVNLDPNQDGGVHNYIAGTTGSNLKTRHQLQYTAANMRWPIYQHFNYGLINGVPLHVHFFSWHAPLVANWLAANVVHPRFFGPALPEAFEFFQHSNFYTMVLNHLTVNDVIIIAGDLNAALPDIQLRWMFPRFVGVSDNLTHIIAFCPNGNCIVDQNWSYTTPFPPHTILTARVSW